MEKMQGTVLWWCEKNEHGIIVDEHKNEYYFDRSVLNYNYPPPSRGNTVRFKKRRVGGVLCAFNVGRLGQSLEEVFYA